MKNNLKFGAMILAGLVVGVALASASKGGHFKKDIITKRFNFEDRSDITGWVTGKGNLKLSDKHSKQGAQSVKWEWSAGSTLVMNNLEGLKKAADIYPGGQPEHFEPAFYPKAFYGGVKLWLYREAPAKGYLSFTVGTDSKSAVTNPKYHFDVKQNFSGWRAVWVQFEEDAKVDGYNGSDAMQAMVVTPSGDLKSGDVYFDLMQLMSFVSYKRHSDAQFANNKKEIRVDTYEILRPAEMLKNVGEPEELSATEESSFEKVAERLEYLILGGDDDHWKKRSGEFEKKLAGSVTAANKTFKKLNLKRKGNIVNGMSLFTCRDEQGLEDAMGFQAVGQATFFPFAFDYREHGNKKSLTKLLDMFDYFLDQGWADGSSLGTVDHVIRLNAIANAVFLARKELAGVNKLDDQQRMLTWHTRFGNLIKLDTTKGENTDLVRGGALPKLISVLVMEDGPKKLAMMKAFVNYMNHITDFAPGYSDTIKPDFSIYHHRGTYLNSYGVQTVNVMALINWLLKDTNFEMSVIAQQQLRNTFKRQYEIAAGLELHPGVCGRFPYNNSAIDRFMLPGFAFMSLTDETVVDAEMGRIFNDIYDKSEISSGLFVPGLTYSGTLGTMNLMAKLDEKMGNQKTVSVQANLSMPYSSMSIQRRNGWVASVKGMSKYIWDFETGHKGENNLGRYTSHGALFLFASGDNLGLEAAGMGLNGGFHWGFLPGATTKSLPIDKVYFENKAHPKYIEGKHRSFSEETFAGGLSAFGKNGMYSFILADTVDQDEDKTIYDDTFRAHKSYFFFEDQIICLGSGVKNDDTRFDTVTTLFQNKVAEPLLLTQVDGKPLSGELGQKLILDGAILKDPQGISYLIPKGNKIVVDKSVQNSLKKEKNGKYTPIEAPHVKAYINHGPAPKEQGYEYLISMDKNAAIAKNYEVLQKNNDAHIVKMADTTAYALFKTSEKIGHGPLISTDVPVQAMIQEGVDTLNLSMANPDLMLAKWNHNMSFMPNDINQAPAGNSLVSLTLKGEWKLAQEHADVRYIGHDEGTTLIKIFCEHGLGRDIKLKRK